MEANINTTWLVVGAIAVIALWLYRQNTILQAVPKEIAQYAPRRWTRDEIRKTYDGLVQHPLDFKKRLPPKLERRYIIVGGCGT